jgi:transposase
MIVVETIAKVRRDHFVHGKRIKEISRERGISRNSVRKILRSGDTEFTYERPSQPLPKLGPFVSHLEVMLEANERRPKRDRLRLTRIFDDLRREGYAGGYDSVRRYARRWREKRTTGVANAFVPLSFAPGEAYQFDWSHEYVLMGGVTTKVKVAHLRLCHSRRRFLIAYPRETQEMVFDAHDQAFAFFGGACARGIYDNMSTAVDAILIGKERRFNRRFERMCSHHLVEPTACSPAAGWEKGQVESQVKTSRQQFFTPRLRVADYDELNAVLRERVLAWAASTRHPVLKERTILEVFEEERPALVTAQGPFRGFHEITAAVSKTCLVSFDRNRYSVSATAVGRPVQIRAYASRIVILQDGLAVGEHARAFGRDRTIYDPWHYVPVLERKPGALRNGAPFKALALPPAMAKIQARLAGAAGGDRQMVSLLVAAHESGIEAVEQACAEALEAGLRSADAILNILSRQKHEAIAAPVVTPAHLRLSEEPVADCARYDRLIAEARRGAP